VAEAIGHLSAWVRLTDTKPAALLSGTRRWLHLPYNGQRQHHWPQQTPDAADDRRRR